MELHGKGQNVTIVKAGKDREQPVEKKMKELIRKGNRVEKEKKNNNVTGRRTEKACHTVL